MINRKLIIAAALVCLANTGFAQTEAPVTVKSEPGKVTVSGTVKTTATVVGIEPATRTVLLKDPKGRVVQVVVGEEARNFDQIKVGDVVKAEYSQALTIMLKKGNAPLTANETQTLARTPAGAKPGGSASREVTIMANVIAVDHQSGMVTLKGPQGNTVDLIVQDPEQLKRIKKGDQMQAVYTEAVAISVEPVAGK
ncbi:MULTISPECIES: hypothetical protein [unclassified Paraburkholderia]|uniref:hypothetical protein n=1 Tax=unclassified Paraburkholderia TaxID=2615204 RepID=UPI00160E000B|nr:MULTISPECIES: hypothetical protein [unclassified Paraburkholderia]MBB5443866.1 Cu/Ag efflux protein CusF [Paraburkholderia sp. WSM4177]MBB5485008.1 Cu/Ag efflux protein CusF [Paraburkholderia sp. WSM4180]